MKSESIFSLIEIDCPVCGQKNKFENICAGAYKEFEFDTDFRVKKRVWANLEYQLVNPLLYFMATCSNCFYTHEFDFNFKEWKSQRSFVSQELEKLKAEHLKAFQQERSWLKEVGRCLDKVNYPFETAVLKFILGIFDEKLLENPSLLNLARYFLRIGWLFRENKENQFLLKGKEKKELKSWEGDLEGIKEKFRDLSQRISELKNVKQFSKTLSPKEFEQKKREIKNQYDTVIKEMEDNLSTLHSSWEKLWESFENFQRLAFHTITPVVFWEKDFFGYPTFQDFLENLKEELKEIPLDEKEALELALNYYQQSFEKELNSFSPTQKIQSVYLMGELSQRIGDADQAQRYFSQAIELAEKFIKENKNNLSKTALAQKIFELATRFDNTKKATVLTEG